MMRWICRNEKSSNENRISSGRPRTGTGRARWLAGLLGLLAICAAGLSAGAQTAIAPSNGAGTEGNPFQISQLGHLVWMGERAAAGQTEEEYYRLMNDIDASETAHWNDEGTDKSIKEGFKPIGGYNHPFFGFFDGNGKKITGLTIHRLDENDVGLFGRMGSGGEVKNLGLIGGSVIGYDYVGGLAGRNYGDITNCYAAGTVSGDDSVGGLVGYNYYGSITNCYAMGAVSGDYYVGGLVGYNDSGSITNCYATGAVSGDYYVGGLVGDNGGDIENCYATGAVRGDWDVGGLVGDNHLGSITNCYWDVQTSGQTASAGGEGKTTEELKRQATFVGWDFSQAWDIEEGLSYPYLRFSPPPFRLSVTIHGPGGVTLNPPGGVYAPGTRVTLTAIPANSDNPFSRWTGAVENPSAMTTIITMDSHKSVVANFSAPIRTLADLQAIASGDLEGHYILMNDIDASETANWNDEGTDESVKEGFKPIGDNNHHFLGFFDGNGKKITGLTINRPIEDRVGLFGRMGSGGEVKNLGLVGGAVRGIYCVGGLVGYNSGDIANCYATGSVSGDLSVGGLVGCTCSGSITNCYATGAVTGNEEVGGLVGYDYSGSITNCYATGSVTGYTRVGGLVGYNSGDITNCYATGAVSGDDSVGGLAGYNFYGSITNCYATGAVSGDYYVGGLVGLNSGEIANCYWDVQTSGQTNSAGGEGKTTEEMMRQATFVGWDLSQVWGIEEGSSYPYLRFSPPPFHLNVTINGPGSVMLSPPGGVYAPGIRVTLTATPADSDGPFLNWTGAVENPSAMTTIITMDSHKSVTAYFITPIRTLADLQAITSGDLDGHYILMNDIDASETANWNDEGTDESVKEGFEPLKGFAGIFDGNGKKITGLTIHRLDENDVGLFGRMGSGGEVKNLGLIGGAVHGDWYVGGLVGRSNNASITNCYWDVQTSGQTASAGGEGKTTEEMMRQATFVDWDFVQVWAIDEGQSYPYLRPSDSGPTPTPTPTGGIPPTATSTPSASPTQTRTPSPTPTGTVSATPTPWSRCDLDGDGKIDEVDLLEFLQHWHTRSMDGLSGSSETDLNEDGVVNGLDLLPFSEQWNRRSGGQ